jgi:hypothetical protein
MFAFKARQVTNWFVQFGVAYMTGYNDRMQFTITSRKEMPSVEFRDEIERVAGELYALFDKAKTQTKSKL